MYLDTLPTKVRSVRVSGLMWDIELDVPTVVTLTPDVARILIASIADDGSAPGLELVLQVKTPPKVPPPPEAQPKIGTVTKCSECGRTKRIKALGKCSGCYGRELRARKRKPKPRRRAKAAADPGAASPTEEPASPPPEPQSATTALPSFDELAKGA